MKVNGTSAPDGFTKKVSLKIRAALMSPILLVSFLVLGVAARLRQYVGCPSYWYDEAFLLQNIFDRSFLDLVGPLQNQVVAPPLYLWILRGLYDLAGGSEWTMRLPSTLASILALALMIPLARRLVGSPGWICAVTLCAVSKHALTHGYELRPYATDFLLTEAIVLTAHAYLSPDLSSRSRQWMFRGLAGMAMIGPWLSFPSAFVFSGASLALLWDAIRRRSCVLSIRWFCLNLLFGVSGGTVWCLAARHQYYPGLREHWTVGWNGFPADNALLTLVRWVIQCMVGIGHYGTTGMGLPLLVLAVLGLVALWRRSRFVVPLLVVPPIVAMCAAMLRMYPLGDRTLFFLVPTVWLPACVGLGVLLRGQLAWFGATVLAIMLVPDVVRTGKYAILTQAKVDFRGAFSYVQAHWLPGDTLWVAQPEVHEVYFGRDPSLLGCYTPNDRVAAAARSGRLWMIYYPPAPGRNDLAELFDRLKELPSTQGAYHRVKGLEIALYLPYSYGNHVRTEP